MSSKLIVLESRKLLKELEYLISDIEFKNEFLMENNHAFEVAVKQFMREKPFIKELCIEKFGSQLDKTLEEIEKSKQINYGSGTDLIPFTGELMEDDENSLVLEIDEVKIRKLYREIVQVTHPDKVKSDALNLLYNKAVDANKIQDLLALYSICDELRIDFHASQKEIDTLIKRINLMKAKQNLFESSHLWAWCKNNYDENKRKEIITHFLLHNAPAAKFLF